MGERSEIINLVEKKTEKFSIGSYNNLKNSIQKNLVKIEKYFQLLEHNHCEIKNNIKKYSKINTLNIAEGSSLSRSTIYANPNTLGVYVEERIKEIKENDILGIEKVKLLKEEKREFTHLFEGLKQNIIETHFQTLKIEELESEVQALNSEKENLILELNRMKNEYNKLKNSPSRNNIIKL